MNDPSGDGFLQNIISRTTGAWSDTPLHLPITLNVGGTLVVGTLISEGEYLDGLGTKLTSTISRAYSHQLAQSIQEKLTRSGQSRSTQEIESAASHAITEILGKKIFDSYEASEGPLRYIHLKDVKITAPGAQGGVKSDWW